MPHRPHGLSHLRRDRGLGDFGGTRGAAGEGARAGCRGSLGTAGASGGGRAGHRPEAEPDSSSTALKEQREEFVLERSKKDEVLADDEYPCLSRAVSDTGCPQVSLPLSSDTGVVQSSLSTSLMRLIHQLIQQFKRSE